MRTNDRGERSRSCPIRVVALDAVGTLIHPVPPAAEVYAALARRHGLGLDVDVVDRRFRAALQRQEQLDLAAGWRTSHTRERERWQQIVRDVFAELPDPQEPLEELWLHFAQPDVWRCYPDVPECLARLKAADVRVVIASNFDGRLRTVVAGLSELAACRTLVISSEVGWRKPAVEFFTALCVQTNRAPDELCFIGDDLVNDWQGAREAGVTTLLLDRAGRHPGVRSITGLADLPQVLFELYP